MLDKPVILREGPQHPAACQQLVMAQNLAEFAIIAHQWQAQPRMDPPADLDDATHRLAPLQRSGQPERITLAMSTGDFRKAHAPHLNTKNLAQPRPGDPEAAFPDLIYFDDRDAGQSAAQSAGINVVSCDPSLAIATRLPVLNQHFLSICNTGKNILLTHDCRPRGDSIRITYRASGLRDQESMKEFVNTD